MMRTIKGIDTLRNFAVACRRATARRSVITILFCLTAVEIQVGCGGIRYPNYYTLNLPAAPDPAASENTHATLAIREFSAPTYLRQGDIVYKTSPEQIGFYAYHRWATDPREVVTQAVIDHLRARAAFALVKSYDGRADATYLLTGRLEKLDELDHDGGVKVEAALSVQMTSTATGATVWTNTISELGDVSKHDVASVVSEMNRTMGLAIKKLLDPMPADVAIGPRATKAD